MKLIHILLYTFSLLCVYSSSPTNFCQKYVDSSTCILDKVTAININSSNPCIFSCANISMDFISTRRIFLRKEIADSKSIFTTIQADNYIKTYKLPITFDDANAQIFSSLSEIICPSSEKLLFSITTNSVENVSLQFNVKPVSFTLPDIGVTVMASPVSPWVKYYNWKEKMDSVFISVESKTLDDENICAILHLQQAKCPLASNFEEIQGSKGKYQSFQKFGGVTVKRSEFPNGFFIVILPLPSDDLCLGHKGSPLSKRRKTVVIKPIETAEKYAWISYTGSFLAFTFLIGAWLYGLRKMSYNHFSTILKAHGHLTLENSNLREPFAILSILQVLRLFSNRRNPRTLTEEQVSERCSPEPGVMERSESDDSLLVATLEDPPMELIDLGHFHSSPPSIPITTELNPGVVGWWKSEATYEEMNPSSKVSEVAFSRNILIVAAFSTIPVYSTIQYFIQLADHKLDTCYFNYRCMISVGYIQDFSKMFTNFAYVVVALAFKHFIGYHEKLIWATAKRMGRNDVGICRQYSIFNVLTYELILQAVLSCFFHACPNFVTVKFDIIFIYALALTFIGCIWSLRHSDYNQFTYSTFGLIASTLFLADCKILLPSWIFWIIVGIIQMYLVLSISFLLVKFGTFTISPITILQLIKKWKVITAEVRELNLQENISLVPIIFRVTIGIVINFITFIIGAIFDYDFYSYIFIVVMVNAAYYTIHYLITKKILMKESGTLHGWLSILAAIIFTIPSIVFLKMGNTNYDETPAESLTHNSSCLITVFSAHDLWHFTSAISTFALFTGILVLDDDQATKKSSNLPVF